MPGIAPAIGGPAHSAGRAYDAEPVETTMLRPAGEGIPLHAQPYAGGSAAVEAQPPRRTSGLPNWVYIILAAVLVIGVGIGATITAQRLTGSDVDEQTPPPPDPTVAEAPLAPGQVDSELIEQPADGTTGGRLRVTWEAGENYDPQHDDIMIGWKDLPERYSQRYPELAVEGREYVVLTVPPDLERPCLTLRTVRDNGHTSEPVEHCPSDLA